MPHELAVGASCSLDEAMGILMVITAHSMAEPFILAYHTTCPENNAIPFTAQSIYDGLPTPPIYCDVCDQEVEDKEELVYDFIFNLTPPIQFII